MFGPRDGEGCGDPGCYCTCPNGGSELCSLGTRARRTMDPGTARIGQAAVTRRLEGNGVDLEHGPGCKCSDELCRLRQKVRGRINGNGKAKRVAQAKLRETLTKSARLGDLEDEPVEAEV
jgi:hypothetical protein